MAERLGGIPKSAGLGLCVELDLGVFESPALGHVERRQGRKGVACVPRDTVVVAEGGQWIADGMVNPGTAHVDRRTGEIDGVQPAADAVAGFEHYGVDAGLTQPRCGGQPRDSSSDDHHALDWPGDLVHRAIVAPCRRRWHPIAVLSGTPLDRVNASLP